MDGKILIPSSNHAGSSPLENFPSGGPLSMHYEELSQSILDRDKKEKSLIGEQGANMCEHAWSSMDHHPKSWSSLSLQPASYSKGRGRADISAAHWESSLFSSSFSEIFSRKCKLPFHHTVNCILSCVLLCFSLSYNVLLQRAVVIDV